MNKELYLQETTLILTDKGMVPLMYLKRGEHSIAVISDDDLEWSDNYVINRDTFSSLNYFYNSDYSNLISNKVDVEFSNSTSLLTNNILYESTPSFTINGKLYLGIPYKDVLTLSLIISNCFVKENDTCYIKSGYGRYVYKTFKYFNNKYKIYFPYNRITKAYEFKTNLFKEYKDLSKILLNHLCLFKDILFILREIADNNYKYNYFIASTYEFACLFQALLAISDNSSKIVFDKSNSVFKITYVSNKNADYAMKGRNVPYRPKNAINAINITLQDVFGKIIISQDNDKVTTASIIEADSTFYDEENS